MTRCVGWSTQLLDQFSPVAAGMLAVCIPILEPLGLGAGGETRSTLLGYNMTFGAALAIAISSVLGLLVNYSTFLVIGETSSLTYNVVGHIKTVIILVGGVLLFGDDMEFRKALGVGVTIVGMVWYSRLNYLEKMGMADVPEVATNGDLDGDAETKVVWTDYAKDLMHRVINSSSGWIDNALARSSAENGTPASTQTRRGQP